MLIVWGTKVKRRKMGRRADFCPICRRVAGFKLERVESVGHLYYIPIGRRTIHGLIRTCETCKLSLETEMSDAESAVRDRGLGLSELVFLTHPVVHQLYAPRLEVESRIASRRLKPEERQALLLEPFILLNTRVAAREQSIHFDPLSGLSLLATFAVPIALLLAGQKIPILGAHSEAWAGASFVLLGLITLGLLHHDSRRHARSKVLPVLGQTLAPLQPTLEEISALLADLKTNNWAIGKRLRPTEVHDAAHQAGLNSLIESR